MESSTAFRIESQGLKVLLCVAWIKEANKLLHALKYISNSS